MDGYGTRSITVHLLLRPQYLHQQARIASACKSLKPSLTEFSAVLAYNPTKGLPRQFWLMKGNNRCSVLFHLLVPGGK